MPLYEYGCTACHSVTSMLEFAWSTKKDPVCRKCGGTGLSKLVSKFAFHRSWGASMNWTPSGETLSDVDEDDPKSLDRFMGRIKDEMGGQVTPDFNQMRRELTADP